MKTAFLLVSCCLEPSREEMLSLVVHNIREQAPWLCPIITVFDNASSEETTLPLLSSTFNNVFRSDRNVGYWSAIDWWLESLKGDPPEYTYIIESDMIHYGLSRLNTIENFLDVNSDVGSVRCHEYSVAQRHLYDKDRPRPDSRRALWQSHTNRVTKEKVTFEQSPEPFQDIWRTTFLSQLPAVNRYRTMVNVFERLRTMKEFTEPDFQSMYWEDYQVTGIIDGGIYHCNHNPAGSGGVTGSWTPAQKLHELGYKTTRSASIVPRDQYTVVRLL